MLLHLVQAGGARDPKDLHSSGDSQLPLFQTADDFHQAVLRRCETLQETTLTLEHVVGWVLTAGKNYPARKSHLGFCS